MEQIVILLAFAVCAFGVYDSIKKILDGIRRLKRASRQIAKGIAFLIMWIVILIILLLVLDALGYISIPF